VNLGRRLEKLRETTENLTRNTLCFDQESNCLLPEYKLKSPERQPTGATPHVGSVDMLKLCLHTSLEMPSANSRPLVSVRRRATYRFHPAATSLFYGLKNALIKVAFFRRTSTIQRDSKLLSEFPWPIIFKPETIK
jgi:hypothetical protein